MRKILIVEDETPLREAYGLILSTQPYDLYISSNGKQALDLCEEHTFDLILLDLMMPVINGVEFMRQFKDKKPSMTKVIMLSNVSSSQDLEECITLGAHKNVVKASLSPKQLLTLVRYELEV